MGRAVRVRVVCQVRELVCWVAVGRGHEVSSKLAAAEEVQGMREVDRQVCWAAWPGLLGSILGTVGLEKGLKISWKFGLKMGRNR